MSEINVEMLKEKIYPAVIALSCIGEVCVDVSKQHISAERAIDKIRNYLYDTDVIGSRYRLDRLIEDCMEPIVSNTLDDKQVEWLKNALTEYPIHAFEANYPSCCDGCSNNPKNGGSGICNCILPYMQNPTTYTIPASDSCMANSTGGYVFTTSTKLPDVSTQTINVSDAVKRTQKYIKR